MSIFANRLVEEATHNKKGAVLFSLYLILVVFRFWLTGDRDILATNSPYDEFWYIDSASRYVWGGSYDHMAFAQMPIYSIWLMILNILGVHARLGIDVLWISSSLYFAFSISRLTKKPLLGLLGFIILAFHPYALFLFDRALTETLLASLSLLSVAAAIHLWQSRVESNQWQRIPFGIFIVSYGLAYFTRKEGVVLLVPLLLMLAISLYYRRSWWGGALRDSSAFRFVAAPLAAIILMGFTISAVNYCRIGLFVNNELAASGYQRAIKALNSIDVGRTPRHATVTAEARTLAYQASPTFKELAPFFEGPPGQSLVANSQIGVDGEIGNGWFYWALRDAGAYAGWFSNAKRADKKFGRVADEVNAAFNNGTLKKRALVISSFVDPDFGKWLGLVPGSTWSLFQLLAFPNFIGVTKDAEDATLAQYQKYVSVTGRRSAKLDYLISGWVTAPANSSVAFGGDSVPTNWSLVSKMKRSDIASESFSFSINTSADSKPLYLYVKKPTGESYRASLEDLKLRHVTALQGDDGAVAVGVEELSRADDLKRLDRLFGGADGSRSALAIIYLIYRIVGLVICLLVVAALVFAVFSRRVCSIPSLLLILVTSVILARCLMLGILDASSWTGMQVRYVFPALPYFVVAGLFSIQLINISWSARTNDGAQSEVGHL